MLRLVPFSAALSPEPPGPEEYSLMVAKCCESGNFGNSIQVDQDLDSLNHDSPLSGPKLSKLTENV